MNSKFALNDALPKTWKCKIFGCKDELLPFTYMDKGERHGLELGQATATATFTNVKFSGCDWCGNYKAIRNKETDCYPKWFCDCELCQKTKTYRKNELRAFW